MVIPSTILPTCGCVRHTPLSSTPIRTARLILRYSPLAIAELLKLAPRFPNARLVLDHVAWPDAQGAPDFGLDGPHREFAAHKNFYYKFSTINIDLLAAAQVPASDMLRHVVDVYGADHVLWCSDIGNSAGTYAEMVHKMVAAAAKLNARNEFR